MIFSFVELQFSVEEQKTFKRLFMTLGEKRIQTNFNASGNTAVDEIKHKCALLIDNIDQYMPNPVDADQARWKSLALTAVEEGAMYAVKALTYS